MRKIIGQLVQVELYGRHKRCIVGLNYSVARRGSSRRGSFYAMAKLRSINKLMETSEIPTISEKVKFWEEQDRINQALIPRVIKMHEITVDLHNAVTSVTNDIALVEAKANNYTEEKVAQLKQALTISFVTERNFREAFARLEGRVSTYPELAKELTNKMVRIEETLQASQKQKEQEQKEQISRSKQLKRLTILALLILAAILSMSILSLVVAPARK